MTKNITLSIDEDVLEKVRVLAAEQKTTVNAMVRDFLNQKASGSDLSARRREAVKRLLALSRSSPVELGKDWKFNREDIYAERLSRYERNNLRSGGNEE